MFFIFFLYLFSLVGNTSRTLGVATVKRISQGRELSPANPALHPHSATADRYIDWVCVREIERKRAESPVSLVTVPVERRASCLTHARAHRKLPKSETPGRYLPGIVVVYFFLGFSPSLSLVGRADR